MTRRSSRGSKYNSILIVLVLSIGVLGIMIGLKTVNEKSISLPTSDDTGVVIPDQFYPNTTFSFIQVIENDTNNLAGFTGQTHFATNFTISNESYIFEINMYLHNYTTFNESGVDGDNNVQYLWLEIRNNLSDPDVFGSDVIRREVKQINSDEIFDEWYAYELETPLRLDAGMYYLYLDLDSSMLPSEPAEYIKWWYTLDSTTGDNSTLYQWQSNDWNIVAADFLYTINMTSTW